MIKVDIDKLREWASDTKKDRFIVCWSSVFVKQRWLPIISDESDMDKLWFISPNGEKTYIYYSDIEAGTLFHGENFADEPKDVVRLNSGMHIGLVYFMEGSYINFTTDN